MTERNGTGPDHHSTSEEAARAFLAGWERRNWNVMAGAAQVRVRKQGRAKPRQLERLFGGKRLLKWVILGSRRTGRAAYVTGDKGELLAIQPDADEVRIAVSYRIGPMFHNRIIPMVVVREDSDGNPVEDGKPATWGVNPTSALREHPQDWAGEADPLAMADGVDGTVSGQISGQDAPAGMENA